MLNPSHMVRSVEKYVGAIDGLSAFTVTRSYDEAGIVNEPTIYVHGGAIEARGAQSQPLGSGSWSYQVFIDCYVPQPELVDYDDTVIGEALAAIGLAIESDPIRFYDYRDGESQTGTFVKPTSVKIDLEGSLAAKIEIVLEIGK